MTLEPIFDLIRARTGLVFPEARRHHIDEVIRTSMAAVGITEPLAYAAELHGAAYRDLIDRITVGETYFFRDLEHYTALREEVLPELAKRGRSDVRGWSAGCASGEEAYSLAMACDQAGFRPSILGTDLSSQALQKARLGCYRPWSLRGAGQLLAGPYLERRGEAICVDDRTKAMVELRELNLTSDAWPPTERFDFVFCRNVLIYLAADTQEGIVRRFYESLDDGGWLFAGPSDPPLDGFGYFEMVVRPNATWYRRRRQPVAVHPAPIVRTPQPVRPVEPVKRIPVPEAVVAPVAVVGHVTRHVTDEGSIEAHLRDLANQAGSYVAERELQKALATHPMSPDLHYLHAILLTDIGRHREALDAARRVLYLSSSTVVAHLLIAMLQRREGDVALATKTLRGAARLLSKSPPDELVPLGDGQTAGQLAALVERELAQ